MGKLFKQQGRGAGKTNNSFWNKKQQKSNGFRGDTRELHFELVGDDTMGITFKGFFDQKLKDKIKAHHFTQYNAENKMWILPMRHREDLLADISSYCIENQIVIVDIPDFVKTILNSFVPFGKNTKLAKTFSYEEELHKQKGLDALPEKMQNCLYQFQKEGILFGQKKFGRLLFGDEMGVGKTI